MGRDFPPIQTGPEAHPASCTMGTGSLPGVKYDRGVLLTNLLVLRSCKSRAIPLPTIWTTTGPVKGTLSLLYLQACEYVGKKRVKGRLKGDINYIRCVTNFNLTSAHQFTHFALCCYFLLQGAKYITQCAASPSTCTCTELDMKTFPFKNFQPHFPCNVTCWPCTQATL